MAEVNPLLIAIIIVLLVIMIILIVLVIMNRQTSVISTSTSASSICTQAPPVPSGLSISNPQGDLLVVSWSPIAKADSYIAYIGTSPGFAISAAINSTSTKYSSTSFTNLALGATYYVKVKSVNSCGTSDVSSESVYTLSYKFPSRFVIANQLNATFLSCDNHDDVFSNSDTIVASRFCSDLGSRSFYQTADKSIRQSDRPTYCMTRDPGFAVVNRPCTGAANQQWAYNTLDSTLCSGANPGSDCLSFQPINSAIANITWGPKSTPLVSAWNINPV